METDNKKFILTEKELRVGAVSLHRHMLTESEQFCSLKVLGGGWFSADNVNKILYFFGTSHEFGQCSIEQLKEYRAKNEHIFGKKGKDFRWIFSNENSLEEAISDYLNCKHLTNMGLGSFTKNFIDPIDKPYIYSKPYGTTFEISLVNNYEDVPEKYLDFLVDDITDDERILKKISSVIIIGAFDPKDMELEAFKVLLSLKEHSLPLDYFNGSPYLIFLKKAKLVKGSKRLSITELGKVYVETVLLCN